MAKTTASDKVKAIPESKKDKIRELIGTGKSIVDICEKLKLEYNVVWTFLDQDGRLPWQGAKTIITHRLKETINATKRADRERLAKEIGNQVDYLYYSAKRLSKLSEKAKKSS